MLWQVVAGALIEGGDEDEHGSGNAGAWFKVELMLEEVRTADGSKTPLSIDHRVVTWQRGAACACSTGRSAMLVEGFFITGVEDQQTACCNSWLHCCSTCCLCGLQWLS